MGKKGGGPVFSIVMFGDEGDVAALLSRLLLW